MTTFNRLTAALALLLGAAALANAPKAYHRPQWADFDGDGWNTRAEVLFARCSSIGTEGKHVQRAVCKDAYTGLEIATDSAPQAIQIDHLLPAARAWAERSWTKAEFSSFFSDGQNLSITRSRTNLRKGALLPNGWCPASPEARVDAAKRYMDVAARYRLALDYHELAGLEQWLQGRCAPGAKVLGGDR